MTISLFALSKTRRLVAAAPLAMLLAGTPAKADAADRYQSAFTEQGFLLRALLVCESEYSTRILKSTPLGRKGKRILKFYEDRVSDWLDTGWRMFDDLVLKDGLQPACRAALWVAEHGEARTTVLGAVH